MSWTKPEFTTSEGQYLEAKGREITLLSVTERLLKQLNLVLTSSTQREEHPPPVSPKPQTQACIYRGRINKFKILPS